MVSKVKIRVRDGLLSIDNNVHPQMLLPHAKALVNRLHIDMSTAKVEDFEVEYLVKNETEIEVLTEFDKRTATSFCAFVDMLTFRTLSESK